MGFAPRWDYSDPAEPYRARGDSRMTRAGARLEPARQAEGVEAESDGDRRASEGEKAGVAEGGEEPAEEGQEGDRAEVGGEEVGAHGGAAALGGGAVDRE